MTEDKTTQPRLEVERDGWKVTLTFRCANSYDAMRLYDQVLEGTRSGPVLRIDVEIANG